MSRTHKVARGALLLGAVAAVASACHADDAILGPTANDPIFQSYVALGNSITAGWQSGGINDSTQKQSYALLVAKAMNTRFAYPALAGVGCPPPVSNLLTQARVGGATSTPTTCQLRSPASVTALTNNVAVPGITSLDPVSPGGTPGAQGPTNPLVQLFLGGETMVQKALDNRPTFATVWVGNNDVLGPATSGFPAGATPVPTFVSNYAKDINALTAGAPGLKGVLIGVVQVSLVPILIPVAVFTNPTSGPAALAAASQVAGRPVTVDPITCAGANQGALIAFNAIAAIKNRPGAPANGQIFCQKVAGGGASDPGDAGVLDIAEQAAVSATVNGYNAYIKAKADSIGFAYYDPNGTFGTLRADPTKIPPFPNLASTTAPFGQYFSLDGVHPSAAAHVLIANELITAINTKYGTHLPSVQ